MVGTPAGMVKHPDAITPAFRVVAGRLRWDDPLGDRPYTARLMYDDERRLDGPFPLTPQLRNGRDALTPEEPQILHPLEERYARLVQADALLAWAETLYRTEDAANLERARELYKAAMFIHGEDPGTSAYLPSEASSRSRGSVWSRTRASATSSTGPGWRCNSWPPASTSTATTTTRYRASATRRSSAPRSAGRPVRSPPRTTTSPTSARWSRRTSTCSRRRRRSARPG